MCVKECKDMFFVLASAAACPVYYMPHLEVLMGFMTALASSLGWEERGYGDKAKFCGTTANLSCQCLNQLIEFKKKTFVIHGFILNAIPASKAIFMARSQSIHKSVLYTSGSIHKLGEWHFGILNQFNLHVFGVWEKTGATGVNTHWGTCKLHTKSLPVPARAQNEDLLGCLM